MRPRGYLAPRTRLGDLPKPPPGPALGYIGPGRLEDRAESDRWERDKERQKESEGRT